MNAKEAAEMIEELTDHTYTIKRSEEYFREKGDDYQAGKFWAIGNTLQKCIDELEERMANVQV